MPVLASAGSRKVAGTIWLKHVWVLHVPWLLIGPVALLTILLAAVERAAGATDGVLIMVLGLFAFPIWLITVVVSLMVWAQRAQEDYVQTMLVRNIGLFGVMMVCAIATAAAAMAIGGVGAGIAVYAPYDLW